MQKINRLMDTAVLIAKFRGALLGTLVGDCCGAPYEGDIFGGGEKRVLRRNLDKLEGEYFKAPFKKYTDDTAMTKSVARCLIDHKGIPSKELASNFVKEYYKDPRRGYGGAVVAVFEKLRENQLSDPLGPGQQQFDGKGSYGNGAAMRVAPVGLFCHNKPDQLVDLARKSAEITHTHKLGVNGAIIQATAVNMLLKEDPSSFNTGEFLNELSTKVKDIEKDDSSIKFGTGTPFSNKLQEIHRLISPDAIFISEEELLNILGNDVTAINSVPTAIYCFLKAQNSIEGIETENKYRRTIEYAISLGGDTDTIGSMAGALAGALYGDSIIPPNLLKHCEAVDEITTLADDLYKASL